MIGFRYFATLYSRYPQIRRNASNCLLSFMDIIHLFFYIPRWNPIGFMDWKVQKHSLCKLHFDNRIFNTRFYFYKAFKLTSYVCWIKLVIINIHIYNIHILIILRFSEFSILGLIISSIGFGTLRPCIGPFGGDQFVLPDQTKQLSLLFVCLCMAHNVGSLSSSFIMPVLRKDVTCFGELTCYSLAFVLPAILIAATTGIFLFVSSLPFYKMDFGKNFYAVFILCFSVILVD